MSLPSIVSYGAGAKTSTLVWDSDLTIPDGYAIDSASGEVGIIGDMSVSGSISADDAVQGVVQVSSALVTATDTNISRLTVGSYQAGVLSSQSEINITSGGLSLIPITPSQIQLSGSLTAYRSGTGAVGVSVYADCITPVTQTTIQLASGNITTQLTAQVNAALPPHTYAIKIYTSRSDTNITSISLTSNTYTSKTLI